MINKTLLFFAAALLCLTACTNRVNPEALYGDWKYIKIDHPQGDGLTDTISTDTLMAKAPFITFSKNNELKITWGGKILSQGKFTISGDNINFTENLAGGQTRTFPFYVSKLDEKSIVFETLGKDGSRVTAIKK